MVRVRGSDATMAGNGSNDKKLHYDSESSSDNNISNSSDDEEDNKDKAGPPWKRRLLDTVVQIKLTFLEFRTKYTTNSLFRQQVHTNIMLAVSFILVVLYFFPTQSTQAGDNIPWNNQASRGSGAVKGGGTPNGNHVSTVKMLTKRQREDHEGLDIIGKTDLFNVKRRYGPRSDIEQAQEKWHAGQKIKSCFQFSPQIQRNGEPFTYYASPKKVFDLAVLQRALKRMGWAQETDLKRASLVLKGVPHIPFRALKQGQMYYDMVGSLGRIGSKKKTQLATLRNYVRKFGCTFESLQLQPRSFDMNKPAECKRFFSQPNTGKMWVLKSCNSGEGSKGVGISVIDDISESRDKYGGCELGAFNYVAQAYIEHPLLLEGSKFDMRAYLFVASTKPYIVFFNPGYIRRSLATYNPKSTAKDDVLTNYHVQMNRKDFTPDDAMWSFQKFLDYLEEQGMCKACGDVSIKLAKIARMVFDSGRSYYKRFPGSFQIVGLDFMMDSYLNLMFIEGNVSPGLGSHNLKWKKDLMDDLVTIMYQQVTLIAERPNDFEMLIGERAYGPHNNYWELVVHEQHETCDAQYKFDPCKELQPEYGAVGEGVITEEVEVIGSGSVEDEDDEDDTSA